jgi:hypothetical protein
MNDSMSIGPMLIGAAVAVLISIGPIVWLDFEPPTTIAFEVGAALAGAALGWLFARLG